MRLSEKRVFASGSGRRMSANRFFAKKAKPEMSDLDTNSETAKDGLMSPSPQTRRQHKTNSPRRKRDAPEAQSGFDLSVLRGSYAAVSPEADAEKNAEIQQILDQRETEPGDTGKAIALFSALVREVPDVLAVRIRGGPTLQEKRFVVVVATLFSESARNVYELQGNLFRKFPDARFDVRVEGIREGGRIS